MKTSHKGYVRPRVLKPQRAAALLLLFACAALYSAASATTSAAGAAAAQGDSAGRAANFADAPDATAAADPNATLIYSQPSDGRSVESSSKIQGGTPYDREAADDFDLNATITRVVVRGSRGGYNMPPNPVYHGVYVRFYDGTQGTPGALQIEHFLPAGAPGVVFDAARPNTFDITLPAPFNAAGRHFLSVQPVFGGSETWGPSSGGYPNVRGSAWVKRDRLANEPWAVASVAGHLNDMSFDLFGTLLSAPRIDAVSPNPVPRSGLLRISGAYFGARGDGRLTIDGKPSQYIAHWADNLIVAYVPETSALGPVEVSITSSGITSTATLSVMTRPADGRIRWRFTVAGDYVPRRAATGPDGTVYFNDERGRLYALAPDGGLKWVFQAGLVGARGPVSVGADGTVYVGGLVPKHPATQCESGQFLVNVDGIFAVRSDGTQKWLFDKTCDGLLSGPNVGPDGNIHAVTDSTGIGAFALKPDGTLAHAPTGRFGVDGDRGTEIVFGPAAPGEAPTQKYFQYESGGLFGYTLAGQRVFLYSINAVGITQPVAGQRTGTVYTITDQQTAGSLFAVSPQGALRWVSPIRPIHSLSIPDAPPSESAVYTVQDGARLHRVNPADGSVVWTFIDNYEQLFHPVASPDDRLVLMGGRAGIDQPGFFEAVSSDGSQLWKQHLPDEPGITTPRHVMPISRARFTADGQTAYIAADVLGDNRTDSNPVYSFFYALDTSDDDAPINQPPKVTMTSPAHNSEVPKGTRLDIKAKVEDDGKIDRVEFFSGRSGTLTLIGTDTTPDADGLYSAQFTPTTPGSYGFFAVAYDAAGLSGKPESSANVWVTNQPPAISWLSPANNSTFAAPAGITLTARASDADGTISIVHFNSDRLGDLGQDTTADAAGNYQIVWSNPPQGTHELTAWATDDSGDRRAATIMVTVGPAPTPTYTVSGRVSENGAGLAGVTLTLSGSQSASTLTDASGNYSFNVTAGANVTVTPSKSGYTFSPQSLAFGNVGGGQTGNFNATANGGGGRQETVWVEDSLPAGAKSGGDGENWNWTGASPAPYSGAASHVSNVVAGLHQHYFHSATQRLAVGAGDTLVAYVYLDPANTPSELMLQWNDGGSWEHRAYWGANQIDWGVDGTPSRKYMGALPAAGQWVRLEVPAAQVGLEGKSLAGMAYTLYGGRAAWDCVGKASSVTTPPPTATDSVWVEDAVPAGAAFGGDGESWNWIGASPAPYSGSAAHRSNLAAGIHQHYFHGASAKLTIGAGDTLYTYVYLDPANTPSEIMLQWNDGSWEHRAYWGANQINWGADGTVSRRHMGALPAAGQWVRLEVPAALVGLEGRTLSGMAFTLHGGRATWDRAGKATASAPTPPSGTVWVDDAVPAGATAGGEGEGWNWIGASPAPHSGSASHVSNLVAGLHQHYFYGATQQLAVGAGDTLYTYVYLDPANTPSEIMLQWNDGSWEHRAYWGANNINWGTDGTNSRRYMGALPAAGQWVRLEVPAAQVGLEGKTLSGMSFTLHGGRAAWDRAGK